MALNACVQGTCSFVYPSAIHTRFEHSLGVAHLAKRLVKSIQQKMSTGYPEITEADVRYAPMRTIRTPANQCLRYLTTHITDCFPDKQMCSDCWTVS